MKDEDIKLPFLRSVTDEDDLYLDEMRSYAKMAVQLNQDPRAAAAIKMLESMGYTFDDGEWKEKPKEPELTPFDLERAKAGDPIVTRDGRNARFIAHVPDATEDDTKVLALIDGDVVFFNESGGGEDRQAQDVDLFMAPTPKRCVWVNVYSSDDLAYVYDTKEKAQACADAKNVTVLAHKIELPDAP